MNKKVFCSTCDDKVDVVVSLENLTRIVKDESYTLPAKVARCMTCQEEVFVEEIDVETQQLFFDAYRQKHHLPTVDHIIDIRKRLGLSQRDFSRVLGLGEITISRYELGSLPNPSSAMLIQTILEMPILEKLYALNKDKMSPSGIAAIEDYLEKNADGAFTGHRHYDEEKFHQLSAFFVKLAHEIGEKMYPTKLNKLMFYADFNHFNRFKRSITGSKYVKLHYGPVPNYFDFKYDLNPYITVNRDEETTLIVPSAHQRDDQLSDQEKTIAKAVYSFFKHHNSKMISHLSHEEEAYMKTRDGEKISYAYASQLNIKV